MKHRFMALAALATSGLISLPCGAVNLSDLLADGYRIRHSTEIRGQFKGCVKDVTLIFADNTDFTCAQTMHHNASSPQVYLLARMGEKISVILIDGQIFLGRISRLAGRTLLPVDVSVSELSTDAVPAESDPARIVPIIPVQSISQIQLSQGARLNDAQRFEVFRSPDSETDEAKQNLVEAGEKHEADKVYDANGQR